MRPTTAVLTLALALALSASAVPIRVPTTIGTACTPVAFGDGTICVPFSGLAQRSGAALNRFNAWDGADFSESDLTRRKFVDDLKAILGTFFGAVAKRDLPENDLARRKFVDDLKAILGTFFGAVAKRDLPENVLARRKFVDDLKAILGTFFGAVARRDSSEDDLAALSTLFGIAKRSEFAKRNKFTDDLELFFANLVTKREELDGALARRSINELD
ncbi:hypothetical protein BC834DRAFT_646928 [Gloeopeniophorella convolvens]|nr:hypothetical protein BC834DRAFT_646928 [Gloeopeniophorella convolvens]